MASGAMKVPFTTRDAMKVPFSSRGLVLSGNRVFPRPAEHPGR